MIAFASSITKPDVYERCAGAGFGRDRALRAQAESAAARLLGGMADLVRRAQVAHDAEYRARLERELEEMGTSVELAVDCAVARARPPPDPRLAVSPPAPPDEKDSSLVELVRSRHSGFWVAVLVYAGVTAAHRGERLEFRSTADAALQALRLAWVADAFVAQMLYRAKATLQARGVPLLPRLLQKLAMALGQLAIAVPCSFAPGSICSTVRS